MKSFKLGIIAVASIFALNSFAQVEKAPSKKEEKSKIEKREAMTPEQKAEHQTARLAEKLSLSENQKAKVYKINLNVNNKNQVIHENKEMTQEFKKEALKGNNASRDYLIRELLTDEQKIKLDAVQEKKETKKAEHGHDHSDQNHKH